MDIEQARQLWVDGILGTKEFRSWLALGDDNFKQVRDADVDNEIDRMARERMAEIHRIEEEKEQARQRELQAQADGGS